MYQCLSTNKESISSSTLFFFQIYFDYNCQKYLSGLIHVLFGETLRLSSKNLLQSENLHASIFHRVLYAPLQHDIHSKNRPFIVHESIYTASAGAVACTQPSAKFWLGSVFVGRHWNMNKHIHNFKIIHQRQTAFYQNPRQNNYLFIYCIYIYTVYIHCQNI